MRRMSDTTADLPALPPSTANEDIRRALADVDARLSAWAAAVAGSKPEEPQRAEAQPASSPSAKPVEPVAEPPAPAVAKTPAKAVAAPAPVVAKAPAKVVKAAAPGVPPPVAAKPAPSAAPAKPEPAAAPPVAQKSSREEDEALLASLDPETAQAIKVMRRLSFEQKSIRQLLEEYQQSQQSQDSSEHKKKSWWSRG